MEEEALSIVSAKESSRKDAKTAKKTGGRGFAPLREMAQTKIKPEEEKSRFFSSSFSLLTAF